MACAAEFRIMSVACVNVVFLIGPQHRSLGLQAQQFVIIFERHRFSECALNINLVLDDPGHIGCNTTRSGVDI